MPDSNALRFNAERERGREAVFFCGRRLRGIGCGVLRLTARLSLGRIGARRRLYPKDQYRKNVKRLFD